jgi:hypothetical protein
MECGEHNGRDLDTEPPDHRVRHRDLVNIAPFQLSEEVLRVHFARLDEALLTPGILPEWA